jgi:competence protein ComEA
MGEILVSNTFKEKVENLVGRRREVALISVLVGVAILIGLLLWSRNAPAIAPPATEPARSQRAGGGAAMGGAVASTPTPGESLYVHVAGAVRRSGLFKMRVGSRIADAVARAGPKPGADLDALNLAEALVDGAKIDVPSKREAPALAAPGLTGSGATSPVASTPGATSTAPAVIDVNSADQVALETIPGVGPVTALAIIDYRTQNGPFASVEELLEVSGIGPATLESIRPYVTV